MSDCVSFFSEVFGSGLFCMMVPEAHGGRILVCDLQNKKLYKIANEKVQQLSPSPSGVTLE
jgi:hypothetical protein